MQTHGFSATLLCAITLPTLTGPSHLFPLRVAACGEHGDNPRYLRTWIPGLLWICESTRQTRFYTCDEGSRLRAGESVRGYPRGPHLITVSLLRTIPSSCKLSTFYFLKKKMSSRVQSCKLVHVSGVQFQTHASSTRGCASVHCFAQHWRPYSTVPSLFQA